MKHIFVSDKLHEYLGRECSDGAIDFAIRVHRTTEDDFEFYIHPMYKDGDTMDFKVITSDKAIN